MIAGERARTHLRPCVFDSVALSVILLHLVEKLVVVHLGHPRISNENNSERLVYDTSAYNDQRTGV